MVQAAKLIGAGSALIALAGVGAGIGIVFGALIQARSRNPTMAKALMGYALLGFALCESVRLFRQLVTFLILFGSKIKIQRNIFFLNLREHFGNMAEWLKALAC